jgi:nicotinamide/nicotinate riboside kinase
LTHHCQPIDQVPYSSQYPDLQDWDDPPTCIVWSKFRSTLEHIKITGDAPEGHTSQDHLNKQVEVGVDPTIAQWKATFAAFSNSQAEVGIEIVWYIIDGFVLYWDKVSTVWTELTTGSHLTARHSLFLGRSPRHTSKPQGDA